MNLENNVHRLMARHVFPSVPSCSSFREFLAEADMNGCGFGFCRVVDPRLDLLGSKFRVLSDVYEARSALCRALVEVPGVPALVCDSVLTGVNALFLAVHLPRVVVKAELSRIAGAVDAGLPGAMTVVNRPSTGVFVAVSVTMVGRQAG